MRNAEEVKATEQPSKKGGRTAATYSVSAVAVAKALSKTGNIKKLKDLNEEMNNLLH